jgi:hypothetical protein
MKVFKLALWAFFTIGLLTFFTSLAGQNQDLVSFSIFRYTSPEYPKWGLLMGAFFLGSVVSAVFFIFQLIVIETKNIRLRRLNKKLERALQTQAPQGQGAGPTTSFSNGNGHSASLEPSAQPSTSSAILAKNRFEDEDV